jgi:hypothetical protein
MTATPWGKFFWADWLADPGLRACSATARGIWMDMLCVAASHEPPGYVAIGGRAMTVEEIARLTGVETAVADHLVNELKTKNVCSRTEDGTLYSRRMIRDHENAGRKSMCEQCGKLYVPQRSDSRYCSNGCKQRAYRNRTNTNRNGNANSNVSVTLSVSNVTDNETDKAKKDKQNQSCYGSPRAGARAPSARKKVRKLPFFAESESAPQASKINAPQQPTSGPATALPDGRAGPPSSDSEASKRPHELTKAEFEAKLDAKRKTGEP